ISASTRTASASRRASRSASAATRATARPAAAASTARERRCRRRIPLSPAHAAERLRRAGADAAVPASRAAVVSGAVAAAGAGDPRAGGAPSLLFPVQAGRHHLPRAGAFLRWLVDRRAAGLVHHHSAPGRAGLGARFGDADAGALV